MPNSNYQTSFVFCAHSISSLLPNSQSEIIEQKTSKSLPFLIKLNDPGAIFVLRAEKEQAGKIEFRWRRRIEAN